MFREGNIITISNAGDKTFLLFQTNPKYYYQQVTLTNESELEHPMLTLLAVACDNITCIAKKKKIKNDIMAGINFS